MSHYCPRRDDNARFFARMPFYIDPEMQVGATPLEDEWRTNDRRIGMGAGLVTCSGCGSITPAAFVAAAKAGQVHGTDKAYKAYVDLPNAASGELVCDSTTTSDEAPASWTRTRDAIDGEGWFRAEDLTPEQRAIAERDGMLRSEPNRRASDYSPNWVHFGHASATTHAKFYLHHIAHQCAERAELYDLVMGGANLGWYVRGMVGMRQEHLLRHPEEMKDDERKALADLRERIPEVLAP